MRSPFNKTMTTVCLLALTVAGTLYATARPDGEREARHPASAAKSERVHDDPGARMHWQDAWYNENHTASRTGGGRPRIAYRHGIWSPEYRRFLMEAAGRERVRNAHKMPLSGSSKVMIDPAAPIQARAPGGSPSRDLRWTNLGPNRGGWYSSVGTDGVRVSATDTGRLNAIVTDPAHPNTLYLAFSGGGLWKSTDGGAFWQAKTETLGSLSVGTVAMDPNHPDTLYLGLGDPFDGTGLGIVKMTHGADSWEAPRYLGNSTSIRDILVSPADSGVVVVATDAGLYRSTDAGKTYAPVNINTGVGGTPGIWSLASGGGNTMVLALTTGASEPSTGQIWRSTDNGASWTRAAGVAHPGGVKRMEIASAPSNRAVMYAVAEKEPPKDKDADDTADIFKSTDGGANWIGIATRPDGTYKPFTNPNSDAGTLEQLFGGQGWYNQMVLVDPGNPDIAYFGGSLLTAKTTDGGNTYTMLSHWAAEHGLPYVHADVHSAHVSANGTLYIGTDGGLFASTNGGTSFIQTLNEGIASHLVHHVCSSPANPDRVLIGLQDNGSRLRVGNTSVFNEVTGGDGFGCNVKSSNADHMISTIQNLTIMRSLDGGRTFAEACTGIPGCNTANGTSGPFHTGLVAWAGDATGNTVFTYGTKVVYRSINYASNWTALGVTGLPRDLSIRAIGVARTSAASPNDSNTVGIAASGGRVFLTTDGGAAWTQAAEPPNHGLSLSSIAFDPTDRNTVYLASVAAESNRAHLWRSQDFGGSWAAIDGNGFPTGVPVNAIVVDPVVRTTLYAATHLGVYRSLDSGSNWERLGAFLPLVNVFDISVSADGNQLRAATFGRSVWELGAVGDNAVPTANFNVARNRLTATFTDTSADSDGSIVRRLWNFGDGVSASSTHPIHTYATPGTYTVTLTVTDNGGYSHTKTTQVVVGAMPFRNDLDGSGTSDLFWFDTAGARMAHWRMSNTTTTGTGLHAVGPSFRVAGTGDLDGDGRADIIWRDNTTNYHYLWRSRGDGTFDTPFLAAIGPGWAVARTTDLNGDGRDDLVWENTGSGQMAYWLMNGTSVLGTGVYSVGTAYRIVGAGDLDGDGRGDILWANPTLGYLYLWRSRGDGTFDTPFVAAYGNTWNIAAVLDVSGDGRADLVWEEPTQGLMATWFMNGATVSSTNLKSVGTAYRIATTGDLNGDGRGDLVWANSSTGLLFLWRSLGTGEYETPFLASYSTAWSLIP